MGQWFSTRVFPQCTEIINLLFCMFHPNRLFLYRSVIGILKEKGTRAVECGIALTALILGLPIMSVIALIIKIDSRGPVIFQQTRIGKNYRANGNGIYDPNRRNFSVNRRNRDLGGRPFTFYKFRTMHVDAKDRFPDLYRYKYTQEEIAGLYFKIPDDPRLTPFGRRLRKTTLDELPNFLNILKGDMSLVGPRPEIPEMIKYYEGNGKRKFDIKPGITGLAQVNGRGLLNFKETVQLDQFYVEKKNWRLDMKIILRTIKVSFLRIGAF